MFGKRIIVNSGIYYFPVTTLFSAVGISIAANAPPVCTGTCKAKISFGIYGVFKLSVHIDIGFTFFFIPNAYNIIVFFCFRNHAARSPNPIASAILGNIWKESQFVSTIQASVLSTNEETCAASLHCRKPFGFRIRNRVLICGFPNCFYSMSVGKCVAELLIVFKVNLAISFRITGSARPFVVYLSCVSVVILIVISFNLIVRRDYLYLVLHRRNINGTAFFGKLHVKKVCYWNFCLFCHFVP